MSFNKFLFPALSVLVLTLLAAISLTGLEFFALDVRFGLFIKDISKYGFSLFPTINGCPYADYPSTMTIIAYWCCSCARKVVPMPAALPTLLCCALLLLEVWRVGEKLGKNIGALAIMLLISCFEFTQLFTATSLDIPVALSGLAMLDILITAPERKVRNALIFAILITTSLIFRGPMGIILTGGFAAGYVLGSRDYRAILPLGLIGGAGAVIACALWCLAIYREGGRELFDTFYQWQIGSRVNQHANQWLLYFFTNAPLSFSPAPLLAVAAIIKFFPEFRSDRRLGGLAGAIVLVLLLLSIPTCKHLRYMTITLPAFALISAWGLSRLNEQFAVLIMKLAAAASGITSLLLAAGMPIITRLIPGIPDFQLWRSIMLVLIAVSGLVILRKITQIPPLAILTAALLLTSYNMAIYPAVTHFKGSRAWVKEIEEIRGDAPVILFELGPDHIDNHYVINCKDPDKIVRCFNTLSNPSLNRMYRLRRTEEVFRSQKTPAVVILRQKSEPEFLKTIAGFSGKIQKINTRYRAQMAHKATVAYWFYPSGTAEVHP